MTEQENENIYSQNDELEVETNEEENNQEDTENEDENQDDGELTDREKQFLARAKKAEAKLKQKKAEPKPEIKKVNENSNDYLSRDEAILLSKGVDEQRLEVLKKLQVADEAITGVKKPLTSFQKDAVYEAVDEKLKAEERKRKAQISSNRGAGSSSIEAKPNMTEEEHKKLFAEYQQK